MPREPPIPGGRLASEGCASAGPPVAEACHIRLGSTPMAKRMSLWCPLCDELVAGFGKEQTVAAMAQHLGIKHTELTEARRSDLARRPWQPLPLADALTVARPPTH